MSKLFHRRIFWLILFVLFNLFMLIEVQNNIFFLSSVIGWTSNGIRIVIGNSARISKDFFGSIKTNKELKEENKKLQSIIEKYQAYYKSIDAVLFENQRLRELLQFRYSVEYDLLPAHIVTSVSQEGRHEFIIDVGTKKQVRQNMIVSAISNQRLVLVGIISKAGKNNAHFSSIHQNDFSIPIITNQSQQIGMLSGDGGFATRLEVLFDDIYGSKNVIVGEEVQVQKYSSLFPQGLPIGVISNITTSGENLMLVAEVEPFIDANNLSLVLVLIPKEKRSEDASGRGSEMIVKESNKHE